MTRQQVLDIRYSKVDGSLQLAELQQRLDEGWTVVNTETSGGGDIMVVIEREIPLSPEFTLPHV